MNNKLRLSPLNKTWILDVDGTILIHNGYKSGGDILIEGVKDFFAQIDKDDMVILVTARKKSEKKNLEIYLKQNDIRFDYIIFNAPYGERVLVNDNKPSGLQMAYAINKKRDEEFNIEFEIDKEI